MYTLLVSMKLEKKLIYQPKLSQKVQFRIFKIGYKVSMAAPGHVAEHSTADLSTQHGRPLNAARQTSQRSTACAVFRDMIFLFW